MARASPFWLSPIGLRNSSSRNSPGCGFCFAMVAHITLRLLGETGRVMAGHSRPQDGVAVARLRPAIHVLGLPRRRKTWMPGTSPGMTWRDLYSDIRMHG